LLAMRRGALDRAAKAARKQSAPKTGVWMPVAAAIAAVVLISYFGVFRNLVRAQTLVTGPGERRIVTLQDGTRISLDERTRVTVRFSRGARRVSLDDGQAEFQVAKDRSRPSAS
jgi:transmembrane sensor